jgi:chorismate synthase
MLRYLLAGESHGPALTGILEGFPAGLVIKKSKVDLELALRQQGYGRGPRMQSIEKDQVEFLAGFWNGRTLGSPIAFKIPNLDFELRQRTGQKAQRWQVPRPGHADLAGLVRHRYDDCAPVAERASARSTAAVTAAGACAKALLAEFGIIVLSHTRSVGSVIANAAAPSIPRLRRIRSNRPLRCLDAKAEKTMVDLIDDAMARGVTLGGEFEVMAFGMPVGLGTYCHPDRRLDALLAADVMAIPAVKAVSIGAGLEVAAADGQHAHDEMIPSEPSGNKKGRRPSGRPSVGGRPALGSGFVRTTNLAGGLEGGITNGEPVVVRGFVKPISSQRKRLQSIDLKTGDADLAAWVRSDTCVVPAAGIVAEAVVAWRLADELTTFLGSADLKTMKTRFADLPK